MEWLFAVVVGVLTATGLYLSLRPRSFDVVLGLTLLSYAVNLFIFGMGRLRAGSPPLIRDGVTHYADPLPPALVLTAIVIGFAMTALLLALAVRNRFARRHDRVDDEGGL
ncbi:multicomponent K+:H+ antiporter subunit C [Chitinivorax tropicus]|uniref:Multicomponent K+:H+ antiporter subunit C n=1 Tax=Chitinivorax tropicus TaxID=714531 RepID=A0A840MM04_9PROT|nr:Na+/H+ antiporter subunit C [Chitinivorax tropicus]MBB5019668.1 multicomponent K+:H+ antiporter subunit C [Chitinivorax tropicus]